MKTSNKLLIGLLTAILISITVYMLVVRVEVNRIINNPDEVNFGNGWNGWNFTLFLYNRYEDRLDAEEITKAFYNYQTSDCEDILELFSKEHLNKIGKDSLQTFFKHRKIVIGNLKKDSLVMWFTQINKGGTDPRSCYELRYNNMYEKGYVTESFKMEKEFSEKIKIKITDYSYEIKK